MVMSKYFHFDILLGKKKSIKKENCFFDPIKLSHTKQKPQFFKGLKTIMKFQFISLCVGLFLWEADATCKL